MRAFVVNEVDDFLSIGVRDVEATATDLDDILVAVDYSGVNFKDALVAAPKSRVRRVASLVGGVDAAGTVVSSSDSALPEGTRVAVHGGALGVSRDGGFAQFIYAPARYVTPLPDSVSTRVAMIIGTAGFTAMESLLALEDHGLESGSEVLVTGATGGVGSQAVAFLHATGYRPVASTGSIDESQWLMDRGAVRVIGRADIADNPGRVLASESWAGAIDCVGGETLAQILRSLRYGAAVAASGLVASAELTTTVYPFITRSVALIGIDSVEATRATRDRVWASLGDIASLIDFDALVDREVQLEDLPSAFDVVREGRTRGRILVMLSPV
ncbi:MAG TPA: YhdH/YhfP family quinone oxidoreductase [Acidimicrobiales bacterium]|nr:YhdH/YhfP family quinone oxidoreductase [Acidimicrobiales bacterium]